MALKTMLILPNTDSYPNSTPSSPDNDAPHGYLKACHHFVIFLMHHRAFCSQEPLLALFGLIHTLQPEDFLV